MLKLEKGIISSSQLTFLIASHIIGGVVTVTFATQLAKHDNWLTILAGFALSLPFILVYTALARRFPDKNLIQIHDIIYGPYLGKLISTSYLFFIFTLLTSNLRYIGDFTLTYILPETPLSAIVILFTFVCAWGVRHGIEVIARMALTLVVFSASLFLLTFLLLLKDMELRNFLPVFEVPLTEFIQATHIIVTIPICEIFIFLLVFPSLNKKQQLNRSVLLGLIIGTGYLFLTAVRNVAVLGPIIGIISAPSYEAVRLIDIGHFLTRLEVLFAIVLIIMVFLKSCVLYYVTVLGIAQLLRLRSYLPLVFPLGIIGISFSLLMYDSTTEQAFVGSNIWPIYALPFEFLLPLLSLVLAKLRRLPKLQGGSR